MKTLKTIFCWPNIITIALFIAFIVALLNLPHTHHTSTDYRQIAFTQNELILTQEETIEELATVIQTTLPAYRPDYSAIDSLNYILDSLYTHPQ